MSSIGVAELVMNTDNSDEGSDDASCWEDVERYTRKINKVDKVTIAPPNFSKVGCETSIKTRKHVQSNKSDALKGLKITDKIFDRLCAANRSLYGVVSSELETSRHCTEDSGLIADIDAGTKSRIDRGRYPIAARIDLHGLSTDVAFDMLVDFITDSFEARHKCVLVITGWGSKSNGTSIIRQNLHRWLQSRNLARLVLYYTQAKPTHGGKGAFYVLLRSKGKSTL
ncbi:Smr/MutS family protein [Candidatus Anaplasma sp. TIGMIC]|uniref:Smr/MutS family protein n=1 Tax=Candidatus Anaplasma sp. TIGMIC TaxID=3020713 RepID=UPI00232C56F7|nr:Smr/MutS family protein [Candidatus Anaplasma sp. TIGMIC]MDB1135076.1 Smr/MutS family protein [Candidatus Anaplasma sp. TIGMIC]